MPPKPSWFEVTVRIALNSNGPRKSKPPTCEDAEAVVQDAIDGWMDFQTANGSAIEIYDSTISESKPVTE